jgi:hypothetical protein
MVIYLAGVTANDWDLERIRAARTYRPAIWLTRLVGVDVLVQVWLQWAVRPGSFMAALVAYLIGVLALAGAWVLLHRSGVLVRRGMIWYIADRRVGSQFLRDLFRLRRQ